MSALAVIPLEEIVRLSIDGRQTEATVLEYAPQRCGRARRGRTCHFHRLSDGVRTFRFDLGRQYSLGTRFHVVYVPQEPSVAVVGRRTSTTLEFIGEHYSWYYPLLLLIGGYFIWHSFLHVRDFRQGAVPERPRGLRPDAFDPERAKQIMKEQRK